MAGPGEYGNGPSVSIKWGKFFDSENLVASQEGVCSIDFVSYLVAMITYAKDQEEHINQQTGSMEHNAS